MRDAQKSCSTTWGCCPCHLVSRSIPKLKTSCYFPRRSFHLIGSQSIKCMHVNFLLLDALKAFVTLISHWDHDVPLSSLFSYDPSPPPTTLAFVRSGLHGHVTGYTEVSFRCHNMLSVSISLRYPTLDQALV